MFRIIITGGPCIGYIEKCIQSILSQTVKDWKALIILDPIDNSYEVAKKYESDKISIIKNDDRRYALYNIVTGIQLLKPNNEDVIATVDADDWLFDNNSLATVKSYYDKDPNTLMTHGSWIGHPDPTCMTNCDKYYKGEWPTLRRAPWKGTQLRTFKFKVWKYLDYWDLKDEKGMYYTCAWDLSFMWPMMEMVGYGRLKFVKEKVYVYNRETPHNDEKINSSLQGKNHKEIAAKTPYKYRETF